MVSDKGADFTLRDECLNDEIFDSVADTRRKLALMRYDDGNPSLALLRNPLPGSDQAALFAGQPERAERLNYLVAPCPARLSDLKPTTIKPKDSR